MSVLSSISPALAACSIATRRLHPGPDGSNSMCDVPTAKKWNSPPCTPCDIRNVTFAHRNFDAADIAQRPAHLQRCAAGALDVAISREPEQQRVAAELEQAATVVVGDLQDRLETVSDCFGDLFRSLPALARKTFRQLGETGDVDEHGAALGRPETSVRVFDQMLLEDPRDVAAHLRGVGIAALRHGLGRG